MNLIINLISLKMSNGKPTSNALSVVAWLAWLDSDGDFPDFAVPFRCSQSLASWQQRYKD